MFFEDRDDKIIYPGDGIEIDYASGALMLDHPLKEGEALLVSYFVEGVDVLEEDLELDRPRVNKFPILYGSVRVDATITRKDTNGKLVKDTLTLSEHTDFTISYLTGKVRLSRNLLESLKIESMKVVYTPLSQIHVVIEHDGTTRRDTHKMTILNDTLKPVSDGVYAFSIVNPAVLIPKISPVSNTVSFDSTIEEGGIKSVSVYDGGVEKPLNIEGCAVQNDKRLLILDKTLNETLIKEDSIIKASYSYKGELLPYAPMQVLRNVLEKDKNILVVEGFDRRDIVKPGDVIRIDNTVPEVTYYMIVRDVIYDDGDTFIEFSGGFPDDIYDPVFYLLDKNVIWNKTPRGVHVDRTASEGQSIITFKGHALETMRAIGKNHLLLLNDRDVYLVLDAVADGDDVNVTIFPPLGDKIARGAKISQLPVYTIGGSTLFEREFVLDDPAEPVLNIEYISPEGFDGVAMLQIDSAKVTLIEDVRGVINPSTYEFNFKDYTGVPQLADAIRNTVSTFHDIDDTFPKGYKPFRVTDYISGAWRDTSSIVPFEADVVEYLPYTIKTNPELFKRKLIRTKSGTDKFYIHDVDFSHRFEHDTVVGYKSSLTGKPYFYEVSESEYSDKDKLTTVKVRAPFTEDMLDPAVFVEKTPGWKSLFMSRITWGSLSGSTIELVLDESFPKVTQKDLFKGLASLVPDDVVTDADKATEREIFKLLFRADKQAVISVLEDDEKQISMDNIRHTSGIDDQKEGSFEDVKKYYTGEQIIRSLGIKTAVDVVSRLDDTRDSVVASFDTGMCFRILRGMGKNMDPFIAEHMGVNSLLKVRDLGVMNPMLGDERIFLVTGVSWDVPNKRVYVTIHEKHDTTSLEVAASTRLIFFTDPIVDFKDWYSWRTMTGEYKLAYNKDYKVEGGDINLIDPIVIDDRFRINYHGLDAHAESEGEDVSLSCRFFTVLPKGSSVEVYMDYINQDQFYIQTLTERDFLKIECLPDISRLVKDKTSGGGSGDDQGGDDTAPVYKGGRENLKYMLRDEEIKKDLYIKIYKWYKDRMRNLASELQLVGGFRFGNTQHVANVKGRFSIENSDVENDAYSLTTDDDIEQITNDFSVFFPVGYDGSAPKYYDRFGTVSKLSSDVYFFNIETPVVDNGKVVYRKQGFVKAANPGWVNTEDFEFEVPTMQDITLKRRTHTVDFRILKQQPSNLYSGYYTPIREEDRLFEYTRTGTFSFLSRFSTGDKIRIDGKKKYYTIADIKAYNTVKNISDTALGDLKNKSEATARRVLDNYSVPYELISLAPGDGFDEKNVPTHRLENYEAGQGYVSIATDDGKKFVLSDKGLYYNTGFSNEGLPVLVTKEDLIGTLATSGKKAIVKRSAPEPFPMWDDEFSFGAKLVGSDIIDVVSKKDRIHKGFSPAELFASLFPISFLKNLEPSKKVGLYVGPPHEDNFGLEASECSVELKGLSYFEERRLSTTFYALKDGYYYKDNDSTKFSGKFGNLVNMSIEKVYDKDTRDFKETFVLRGADRDYWIEPIGTGGDYVSGDYGFINGNVYKNFYDPNNLLRLLIREKQGWQLLELVDKDLFYYDNKLSRCFVDGSLANSKSIYGVGEDNKPLEPARHKNALIAALGLIISRIDAYLEHLRFLSGYDKYYVNKKQYGPVVNTLRPNCTDKDFTDPRGTRGFDRIDKELDENIASTEITKTYNSSKRALFKYRAFRDLTYNFRRLVKHWKNEIEKDYKLWAITLERGVAYQRELRAEFEGGGSVTLGATELQAIKLHHKASPKGYTIINIRWGTYQSYMSGTGALRIMYDIVDEENPTLIERNVEAVFYFYNSEKGKYKSLTDIIKEVRSYKERGVEVFDAWYATKTDLRVIDRGGKSFKADARYIVKDENNKKLDEDAVVKILGVADRREYDSRVLTLDYGVKDLIKTNTGSYKVFPLYTPNGNPKKEALNTINGGIPVPGEWIQEKSEGAIFINTVGATNITVTFDDYFFSEESENLSLITKFREDSNPCKISDSDFEMFSKRPPINMYSADPELIDKLISSDVLHADSRRGLPLKLLNALIEILSRDKKRRIDVSIYEKSIDGLVSLMNKLIDKKNKALDEAVRSAFEYTGSKDGSTQKGGGDDPIVYDSSISEYYEALFDYARSGWRPTITSEEFESLRDKVPTEAPKTKVIRNIVVIRKSSVGDGHTALTVDLGKYPKVRDFIKALNTARWDSVEERYIIGDTTTDIENSEWDETRGVYLPAGRDKKDFLQHFRAEGKGSENLLDIDIQNLDVWYEPVRIEFNVEGEAKKLSGNDFCVGWRIRFDDPDDNNIVLKVRQDNYSETSVTKFTPYNPAKANKVANSGYGTGDNSYKIDITPFHVFCWDEKDADGDRYFSIRDNKLYLKSLRVDYSTDLKEGETLNELLARVNSDPDCNKFFYLNLRWDRGNKRGKDKVQGYFEYTYLPNQSASLPKSKLDLLYLMRDVVFRGTSEDYVEIRITEDPNNMDQPPLDFDKPSKTAYTPISDYPVKRSNTYDIKAKPKVISIVGNNKDYSIDPAASYVIDKTVNKISFSGAYTIDKGYSDSLSINSDMTLQQVVDKMKSHFSVPHYSTQFIYAEVVPNSLDTDPVPLASDLQDAILTIDTTERVIKKRVVRTVYVEKTREKTRTIHNSEQRERVVSPLAYKDGTPIETDTFKLVAVGTTVEARKLEWEDVGTLQDPSAGYTVSDDNTVTAIYTNEIGTLSDPADNTRTYGGSLQELVGTTWVDVGTMTDTNNDYFIDSSGTAWEKIPTEIGTLVSKDNQTRIVGNTLQEGVWVSDSVPTVEDARFVVENGSVVEYETYTYEWDTEETYQETYVEEQQKTFIEDAIKYTLSPDRGQGWELEDMVLTLRGTSDKKLTIKGSVRYSGSLDGYSVDLTGKTINDVVAEINSKSHLDSADFENILNARVVRKSLGDRDAVDILPTQTPVTVNTESYIRVSVVYSFPMTDTIEQLVSSINGVSEYTAYTVSYVNEGYKDIDSNLMIPIPDYFEVTEPVDFDGDFREILAMKLLHMEYKDHKGSLEVASGSLDVVSGKLDSSGAVKTASVVLESSRDIHDLLKRYKGDYDKGLLSINVLPLKVRDFGKLGTTPKRDMYTNEETKSLFGIMGDVKYVQISDFNEVVMLNSIKRRMAKPWLDYTPQGESTDWFYTREDGQDILKNVHMRSLKNRRIAPLAYDTGIDENLRAWFTLVEDGVYNADDKIHYDEVLGLASDRFISYLKEDRIGQIRSSFIEEQIMKNKYLWLYLKFHKEFGCDQRIKALKKKIEDDANDADNMGGF